MRKLLTDLAPGQTYGIRFRLVGNGQQSDWSNITRFSTAGDTVAPSNVTGLTVTPIGTAFEVKWNKVTTNTDGTLLKDFKDYQISVTSGAFVRTWYASGERFDLPIEVNTNAFGSPQPNISVSVSARDNSLNVASNPPSVSASNAAPPAPTGFTAGPTVNAVNFRWEKVNISDLKYYRVYEGTSAGAVTNLLYEGNGNSFVWQSIDFNTTHFFKVAAVDIYNQETNSAIITSSALSFDGSDKLPPANPTWPQAWFSSNTDTSNKYSNVVNATITWNANQETDLGSYVLRYKQSRDTVWTQTVVRGTALTPPDNKTRLYGLVIGIPYDFQVAAVDKTGNSSDFVASPGSGTQVADTTPPNAPSTPIVDNYLGLLRIRWDGKGAGGLSVADYEKVEVHLSDTTGFTPTEATKVDTLNAPSATLLRTNYGQIRYAKLVGVDFSDNKSAASAEASSSTSQVVSQDIFDGAVGTLKLADLAVTTAKINDLAVNDAKVGSLAAGKITAGVINAEIVIGGRIATALTGERVEINSLGIYRYNSNNEAVVAIDQAGALLTGRYRTAISGRRIEMGSAGSIGSINFFTAENFKSYIRSYTGAETQQREAIQIGIGGVGDDQNLGLNRLTFTSVGEGFLRTTKNILVTTRNIRVFKFASDTDFVNFSEVLSIDDEDIAIYGNNPPSPAIRNNFWRRAYTGEVLNKVNDDIYQWFKEDGSVQFSRKNGSYINFESEGEISFRARDGGGIVRFRGGEDVASQRLQFVAGNNFGAIIRAVTNAGDPRIEIRDVIDSNYENVWASAFQVQSDMRAKSEIKDASTADALNAVRAMKVKNYRRIETKKTDKNNKLKVRDSSKNPVEWGFIAQEMPEELVKGSEEETYVVDIYQTLSLVTAAFQESDRINQEKIKYLEGKIVELSGRMEKNK